MLVSHPSVILQGDFNFPAINWFSKNGDFGATSDDSLSYEFLELCAAFDLTQVVNKHKRGGRYIDLFLTSHSKDASHMETHPHINSVAAKLNGYARDFTRTNYTALRSSLQSLDWSLVFATCCDIN